MDSAGPRSGGIGEGSLGPVPGVLVGRGRAAVGIDATSRTPPVGLYSQTEPGPPNQVPCSSATIELGTKELCSREMRIRVPSLPITCTRGGLVREPPFGDGAASTITTGSPRVSTPSRTSSSPGWPWKYVCTLPVLRSILRITVGMADGVDDRRGGATAQAAPPPMTEKPGSIWARSRSRVGPTLRAARDRSAETIQTPESAPAPRLEK